MLAAGGGLKREEISRQHRHRWGVDEKERKSFNRSEVLAFFFPCGAKMPTDDTEKKFLLWFCFICKEKKPEIALKEVTRFHFSNLNSYKHK